MLKQSSPEEFCKNKGYCPTDFDSKDISLNPKYYTFSVTNTETGNA